MFGEIKNSSGEKIDYHYEPAGGDDGRLVIVAHGVTGNKDRPVVVETAKALNAAGISTLHMSFAGNGDSGGRFQDCTVTKEVGDLGAVLDAVGDRKTAYAGHSMGGAVGVLRASEDPRIKVLVSIAGMVDTAGFAEREFGMETPDEGCMWEEPDCPLSSTFVNDMNAIGSVLHLGGKVTVPWLLVHGTEDDVVPVDDSRNIAPRAGGPVSLVEVPGADHSFSEHMDALTSAVTEWIGARL